MKCFSTWQSLLSKCLNRINLYLMWDNYLKMSGCSSIINQDTSLLIHIEKCYLIVRHLWQIIVKLILSHYLTPVCGLQTRTASFSTASYGMVACESHVWQPGRGHPGHGNKMFSSVVHNIHLQPLGGSPGKKRRAARAVQPLYFTWDLSLGRPCFLSKYVPPANCPPMAVHPAVFWTKKARPTTYEIAQAKSIKNDSATECHNWQLPANGRKICRGNSQSAPCPSAQCY